MSVGQEGVFDFMLQDRPQNPIRQLGLVLAYTDTSEAPKRWEEFRVPSIPPRRSEGSMTWTHKDPLSDFVFAQDDWSGGAFQPYYREESNRYAKSNNIDPRWEGVLSLASRRGAPRTATPRKARINSNVFITNGDFEEGLTSGWALASSSTLAIEATDQRTGNYALSITVPQGTSAGDIATAVIANPTVYRSRQIKVIAYVRRESGSDAGILLRVDDGVAVVNSSTITSGTYSYVSAQITVNGSASALTVRLRTSATTTNAAHEFLVDDVAVFPTGGTECVGHAIRASTTPHEAYAAVGRCVVKWNETTYTWETVFIDAAATATSIIEFNDVVYVGFGESSGGQYIYGSGTSWTTAAISATANHQDNHARFFVKARNGFGEWALWKAGPSTPGGTERNAVSWATDPSNDGAWSPSSYFKVGSSNRNITGMFPFNDTFVVGKVDGLWVWDTMINDFVVLTPEWEHSVDEENAAIGQAWQGALYLATTQQGFFELTSQSLTDLSHLLMAPRLTDFGGRVTAITCDPRELILGLDPPVVDTSITKTSRLIRLQRGEHGMKAHTLSEPNIGLIDALTFHLGSRLWAFGRLYDSNLGDYVCVTTLWLEPEKIAAPYADVSPDIEWTGTFDTSIWHGNMPETDKALIALTIWCEDLDIDHTIQVDYGIDGRSSATSRLGVFRGTDRVQTLFFKNVDDPVENAACRFVQMRFTFSTDDTVSPKIYAFALHTQLAPPPIRAWDLYAWVGDGTLLRTGVPYAEPKGSMETAFRELEAQVFPLTLLEDFGQGHSGGENDGIHAHQVRLVNFSRVPTSTNEHGQELYHIQLQKVQLDDA